MTIRILTENDAAIFWHMRLRGLQEDSEAFVTAYEEDKDVSISTIEARFRNARPDNVVFGAFEDSQLAGIAGIYRETRLKAAHKAMLWGVYVAREYRGRGLARQLVQAAIEQARTWAGVQQINLAVYSGNQAAYHLYRSLGFVTWGVEPNAVFWAGQSADDAYMTLQLK